MKNYIDDNDSVIFADENINYYDQSDIEFN